MSGCVQNVLFLLKILNILAITLISLKRLVCTYKFIKLYTARCIFGKFLPKLAFYNDDPVVKMNKKCQNEKSLLKRYFWQPQGYYRAH